MENFKVGDVMVMKKKIGYLSEVGDIFTVAGVSRGVVCLRGEDARVELTLDVNTASTYFTKIEEDEIEEFEDYEEFDECDEHGCLSGIRVTPDEVNWLIEHSDIIVKTLFDNCTMVALRLPSGFVIVETSACVDPDNYDVEVGKAICMKKIRDRIWELEGYTLCKDLWEMDMYEEDINDDDDEYDECEYCDDLDCELNPNRR